MEELDLLKKDWNKNSHTYIEVSEPEIYKMLHTKSSSIVKWILIISILEMLFWIGIGTAFNSDDYLSKLKFEHLKLCFTIIDYFNFAVVLVFIYLFYKNYISISTTESTRKLMSAILRTRKTVQYYVAYNLVMMVLMLFFFFYLAYYYNPDLAELRTTVADGDHMLLAIVFIICMIVFCAILLGVFWLFYKLLYGALLRKLNGNYKELKKIDL